jgi:hypothetical protein
LKPSKNFPVGRAANDVRGIGNQELVGINSERLCDFTVKKNKIKKCVKRITIGIFVICFVESSYFTITMLRFIEGYFSNHFAPKNNKNSYVEFHKVFNAFTLCVQEDGMIQTVRLFKET